MIELIPAIDIIDGKCVRLTQGDYNQKKEYSSIPLEVAKAYEGAGIKRLHLVDLDGAKKKQVVNAAVLEKIIQGTSLLVDFGGGIQSNEDIELVLGLGAHQITGGSIAVRNESLFLSWIEKYGPKKIILGADTKNGKIAVNGWQETSEITVQQIINKYTAAGLNYCISTDVAKDGLLQGPSFDLYSQIMADFPELKLIASGGVRNMEDVHKLNEMGTYGVIIGKAFYEGFITLKEFEQFNIGNKS